jgi:hypothetical protein
MQPDNINPQHYRQHPSGVECIEVTQHCNFCIGNAIKYLWRAGLKGDAVEDLRKAAWYIDREIKRREASDESDDIIRRRATGRTEIGPEDKQGRR